jgi:flagellar biosynthesis protein FlgN
MSLKTLDADLCREHLGRLMGEETRLLSELETLLDSEYGYLTDNDIDGLERAGTARQACMGELLRIEDERRSLCRMSGKSADVQGLEQLLKWCDPQGMLRGHWGKCAEHATRCRERNDRNGMVVAARLKRVEGMLNIITGRGQQPATYGPKNAYATGNVGRMVSSEA